MTHSAGWSKSRVNILAQITTLAYQSSRILDKNLKCGLVSAKGKPLFASMAPLGYPLVCSKQVSSLCIPSHHFDQYGTGWLLVVKSDLLAPYTDNQLCLFLFMGEIRLSFCRLSFELIHVGLLIINSRKSSFFDSLLLRHIGAIFFFMWKTTASETMFLKVWSNLRGLVASIVTWNFASRSLIFPTVPKDFPISLNVFAFQFYGRRHFTQTQKVIVLGKSFRESDDHLYKAICHWLKWQWRLFRTLSKSSSLSKS